MRDRLGRAGYKFSRTGEPLFADETIAYCSTLGVDKEEKGRKKEAAYTTGWGPSDRPEPDRPFSPWASGGRTLLGGKGFSAPKTHDVVFPGTIRRAPALLTSDDTTFPSLRWLAVAELPTASASEGRAIQCCVTASKVDVWVGGGCLSQHAVTYIQRLLDFRSLSMSTYTPPPPQTLALSTPSAFERRTKKDRMLLARAHTTQRRPRRRPRTQNGDLCPTALLSGSSQAGRQVALRELQRQVTRRLASRPRECLSRAAGVVGRAGSDRCALVDPFPPSFRSGPPATCAVCKPEDLILSRVGDLVARRAWSVLCCVVLCCAGAGLSDNRARKRARPTRQTKATVIVVKAFGPPSSYRTYRAIHTCLDCDNGRDAAINHHTAWHVKEGGREGKWSNFYRLYKFQLRQLP